MRARAAISARLAQSRHGGPMPGIELTDLEWGKVFLPAGAQMNMCPLKKRKATFLLCWTEPKGAYIVQESPAEIRRRIKAAQKGAR